MFWLNAALYWWIMVAGVKMKSKTFQVGKLDEVMSSQGLKQTAWQRFNKIWYTWIFIRRRCSPLVFMGHGAESIYFRHKKTSWECLPWHEGFCCHLAILLVKLLCIYPSGDRVSNFSFMSRSHCVESPKIFI
jgi:hypothetical protein